MTTTHMTAQRLGDLLAAPQGSLDGKRHYFRLDHLGDPDQAMLVLGAAPHGQVRVHVYSERDVRERLQDLRGDQAPKVFDYGRSAESFARLRPSSRPGVAPAGNTAPAASEPKDAAVQTAVEAAFQNDAEMLKQVQSIFADVKPGTCPESWNKPTEVVHWPVVDPAAPGGIRLIPFIIVAHTCFFGNFGIVQTTIPIDDPRVPNAPRKIRVCSTQFQFEDERRVMLKHTLKFTQIGFSIGLGFSPSLPPTGVVNTTPQKGDPVHENGRNKVDPATGEPVRFDLDLMQLHSKLKFEAWQRLSVDVGPDKFVCREG